MTCQQVDELAASYALGALSPEERSEVEAHLAECRAHETILGELSEAAGALSASPPALEPAAQLKTRIMQAARAEIEPDVRRVARPRRMASMPARGFHLPSIFSGLTLRHAVAALSLAVIGLFAWNIVLQFSQPQEADAFVRYMGDEDTHAFVYYVQDVGVITVDGLAPLGPQQTYQAWANEDGGDTMSLGTIEISDNGQGFVLLSHHVTSKEPVFITVEQAGGSVQPSGNTVLSTEW